MNGIFFLAAMMGCTSSPTAPQQEGITVDVSDPGPTSDGTTVTDLAVASIEGTTVTLSFTEVADASRSPADYQIRFQMAPLVWSTAAQVTYGTCAGRLTGTAVGERRSCTVANLSPGVSYEMQAIALHNGGTSTAEGKLSNVAAATPGGSVPEGGRITGNGFDQPLEDGWVFRDGSTDPATMPNYEHGAVGGDGYGQANFPPSLKPGTGPIFLRRTWWQVDELTVKMRWQLSPNFNASTGSNNKKIFFLEASNTHPVILGVGRTSTLYLATQRTAEPGDGARHLTGGSITPGRVYDVTLYVRANSVDSDGRSIPNGVATVWLDGQRVIHATDLRFRGNDSPVSSGEIWEPEHGIDGIRWNPTWPSGGDSPSEHMWERIYDISVWRGSAGG